MKILYIITGLGLGGAEKVVCDLADEMSKRGHSVSIAYLTGSVSIRPKNLSVEIHSLEIFKLIDIFVAMKKLKKIIELFKPDIVHSHMIHANILARLSRITCKIPKLICTAHNSNEGGRLRMLIYKLTNFLSDLNTNVSQEATDSLINKGAFNRKNLITVYNGIDLEKFKFVNKPSKKNKEIIFLSVGRFNEQKDYPNLFNAIKILKNRIDLSDIKFLVAGDGALRKFLENMIISLGISEHIELLGVRSDIPELMSRADYFVLSSKYEGFGLVVAEAMACGTYVIATDCGGVSEVMSGTGTLVPIQDPKALALAIERSILLNDDLLRSNAILARNRVDEMFSLNASVKKWLNFYEL